MRSDLNLASVAQYVFVASRAGALVRVPDVCWLRFEMFGDGGFIRVRTH